MPFSVSQLVLGNSIMQHNDSTNCMQTIAWGYGMMLMNYLQFVKYINVLKFVLNVISLV